MKQSCSSSAEVSLSYLYRLWLQKSRLYLFFSLILLIQSLFLLPRSPINYYWQEEIDHEIRVLVEQPPQPQPQNSAAASAAVSAPSWCSSSESSRDARPDDHHHQKWSMYAAGMKEGLYKEPKRFQGDIHKSGAVRLNHLHDIGNSTQFYLEYQMVGADYIQAGLVMCDPVFLQQGMSILSWGVQKVEAAQTLTQLGYIPHHSVSFFFEALARASFHLHQFRHHDHDSDTKQFHEFNQKQLFPALLKLSQWLGNPNDDDRDFRGQLKFTHILLLRALAFAYMDQIFIKDDDSDSPQQSSHKFRETSREFLRLPLENQLADGTWVEKGGFDQSYHGRSCLFVCRLMEVIDSNNHNDNDNDADTAKLKQLLAQRLTLGMEKLATILPDLGLVSSTTSLRIAAEKSHDGKPKTIDMSSMISGMFCSAHVLNNTNYYNYGAKLAIKKYGQNKVNLPQLTEQLL